VRLPAPSIVEQFWASKDLLRMKDLQALTELFGELDRFGAFRIVRRLAEKTIGPH
jgi:hypothetical protein